MVIDHHLMFEDHRFYFYEDITNCEIGSDKCDFNASSLREVCEYIRSIRLALAFYR
jgi:hypothetical protein